MRAWILAAVAALAVGQAEAATYEVKFITDYARGYFEDEIDPSDRDSWALPDAEFDIQVVFQAASPFFSLTRIDQIPGLISASAKMSGFSLEPFAYLIPPSGLSLSIGDPSAFKLMLADGGTYAVIDGGRGRFNASSDSEWVEFKGRWVLTNLDASPVPLPASAFLLIGVLAGLGSIRRIRAAGSQSAT